MCCFTLDPKRIRELAILTNGLIALYTCIFGSLLAIFVPQSCANDHDIINESDGTITVVSIRLDCTLAENTYVNIGAYNWFALGVNYVTCLLLLFGFGFEHLRERFLCSNFDVDYSHPTNYLETSLIQFSDLKRTLVMCNKRYREIFVLIMNFCIFNIVVSAFLVFDPEWYQGFRGITTFITCILFLGARLSSTIFLSLSNDKTTRAVSVNLAEPLQFNIVSQSSIRSHDSSEPYLRLGSIRIGSIVENIGHKPSVASESPSDVTA